MELDVSNDPEIERLGANATALYALEFWETLSAAARRDGRELDPLWKKDDDEGEGEEDDKNTSSTINNSSSSSCCHHTKHIVVTTSLAEDVRLYKRFRSNFGYFPVDDLKSSSALGGDRWTSLLLASEGVVGDFNFMTLLRQRALDMFWMTEDDVCDGLIVVPRAQFIFVEVARIQEGVYARDFREALQLFDIKTQSDVLQNALVTICNQKNNKKKRSNGETEKDETMKKKNTITAEQRALQALGLLQTQWPHPHLAILKQSGVISILKRVVAATATPSSSEPESSTSTTTNTQRLLVHDTARALLQYWQDLHDLGRIPRQLQQLQQQQVDQVEEENEAQRRRLGQQQQRIVAALQRAGQALVSHRIQQTMATTTTTLAITKSRALSTAPAPTSLFGMPQPPSAPQITPTSPSSLSTLVTKTTNSLDDVTVNVGTTSSSSSSSSIYQSTSRIFSDYGMLVLPNFVSDDSISQLQLQAQQALQDLIVEQLQPRGLQVDGDNAFDYPFCRQRPGHRVDNRYHILEHATSPMARLGQRLLRTLPDYLFGTSSNDDETENAHPNEDTDIREGYKILYGGVVHSFPRTSDTEPFPPAQIWHRDGPSLFSNHHETHCFNVFVPLVDVTTENGTTEFIPGTHADVVFEDLATQVIPLAQRDPSAQHDLAVRANATAGTVIVFDIRVLHRGLANLSTQDRPVLYFTMAKDWFLEAHMFQQPQESSPATVASPAALSPEPATIRPSMVGPSHRQLVQGLYRMITGQRPFSSVSLDRHRSNPQYPVDQMEGSAYGHPHYTTRFDLLLLELFQSNESNPSALQNLQAILAFSTASIGDREAMAREFLYSFGEMAVQRKLRVLEEARLGRRRQAPRPGVDNTASSSSSNTIGTSPMATTQDFSTIEQDMTDVMALYKLTATVLLEESVLLSKLGFTTDEQGVCILLALLKANSKHSILSADCGIGVSVEQLEEAFTSWWHAGEGRFAFWQTGSDNGEENQDVPPRSKKLLVVFSSLGSGIARPEWIGSLHQVAKELSQSLDVLHVLDPAFSWYCQDPSCQWRGGDYYFSQLSDHVREYESVMFLGDSMGAAAALRFSELANAVLAFTPQVDISNYEAITRLDFTAEIKEEFKDKVVEAVTKTSAEIYIHYGDKCEEDVRQVQILPKLRKVHLTAHDFDDHILSLHLREKGQLKRIIDGAIRKFANN